MLEVHNDPRGGLPSASGMEAEVNCPGRSNLIRSLKESGHNTDSNNALANQGTTLHAAAYTENVDELEEDEATIVARLLSLASAAFDSWLSEIPQAPVTEIREDRLWIRNRATLEKVASAQVDRAWICGDYGLICDYKTGFKDQTPSQINWQVRTQCVALWHEYPAITHVRAGIAASRLKSTLDLSDYTLTDLQAIEREILHSGWKSKQSDAQRCAGTWCKYCPAAGGYCRENAVYTALIEYEFKGLDKANLHLALQQLTPLGVFQIWQKRAMLNDIVEGCTARMKTFPAELLASFGYRLRDGSQLIDTIDTVKAVDLLTTGDKPLMTREQALAFFNPVMGELVKFYASIADLSQKDAKAAIDELLAPTITRKEGAKQLAKL